MSIHHVKYYFKTSHVDLLTRCSQHALSRSAPIQKRAQKSRALFCYVIRSLDMVLR